VNNKLKSYITKKHIDLDGNEYEVRYPKIEQISGKSLRSEKDIIGWNEDKTAPIYKDEPTQIKSMEDELTYKEHKEAKGEEDGNINMVVNSISTAFNSDKLQIGKENAITNSRNDMCNNGDSDSLEDVMEIEDDDGNKLKKKNFAPFKIKCRECEKKMRYSGVSMVQYEFKYTCDTCKYTIRISNDKR